MPRLVCSFAEFIAIITAHGFTVHRTGATSHVRYRGTVNGDVRYVDVAGKGNTNIKPKTLDSMIRQSGLSKSLFRR